MLQYETVLGPEADGEAPRPIVINMDGHDEKDGKTLAVSGPGLADLHTEGPKEDVSFL